VLVAWFFQLDALPAQAELGPGTFETWERLSLATDPLKASETTGWNLRAWRRARHTLIFLVAPFRDASRFRSGRLEVLLSLHLVR